VHLSAIGLLFSNSNVLMVESVYPGRESFWALPGGVVESGEAVAEGFVREIQEETGLEVVEVGHRRGMLKGNVTMQTNGVHV
jgi:ADP-ribose pyrophosphatase YjhB (NUDIX family)